jgi:phosphoribosyl 1,2-cyclic phosphodiesterase
MVLKCLGSSSAGNCYILRSSLSDEVLIIEAGISMSEIKKALKFKISNIKGCIVSHEHQDHAKYIKEVLRCGIKVLALPDVFNHQGINNPFCKEIEPMHGYKVGGFKILPLPVVHDVPCVGYLIEHEEMGKLIFITDTMMLEYKLPKLNHIMLEANYADEILQYNIDNGIVPVSMRDRLLHSHMELQTTKEILRANDLSSVNEVILLHLSGNNSDAGQFQREVQEASGKPVYIAKSGMEINLNKEPY